VRHMQRHSAVREVEYICSSCGEKRKSVFRMEYTDNPWNHDERSPEEVRAYVAEEIERTITAFFREPMCMKCEVSRKI